MRRSVGKIKRLFAPGNPSLGKIHLSLGKVNTFVGKIKLVFTPIRRSVGKMRRSFTPKSLSVGIIFFSKEYFMAEKWKTPYYFPSKEADVIPWVKNFVTVLLANAARWGIVEALVTALKALGTAYEEAFNRRMLPDSGRVSVEQKNMALKALKTGVQDMVNGHINHNKSVTADDRVNLGLYVYKPGRNPVGAPPTTVVLRVVAGLVRQLIVYFTDSATPDKRGKPYGVHSVEIVCAVLDSPPKNIGELIRSVSSTKSPLILTFREEDRGKTVYLAGRWKGSREQEGPWSEIISAIIP
jgi:hypothetical protein